jgi:hypothetical protein
MRSDAIQRVSKAIAAQIDTALSSISSQHKVIVAPPSKQNLGVLQIVLFPYRLVVNTALRNIERVLAPAGPQGVPVQVPRACQWSTTTPCRSTSSISSRPGRRSPTIWSR